jgi:hypothetical protein
VPDPTDDFTLLELELLSWARWLKDPARHHRMQVIYNLRLAIAYEAETVNQTAASTSTPPPPTPRPQP